MTTCDKGGGRGWKIMKFVWRNLWMAPYQKKWRGFHMKNISQKTHERLMKTFDTHIHLCQSEAGECASAQGKDGTMFPVCWCAFIPFWFYKTYVSAKSLHWFSGAFWLMSIQRPFHFSDKSYPFLFLFLWYFISFLIDILAYFLRLESNYTITN